MRRVLQRRTPTCRSRVPCGPGRARSPASSARTHARHAHAGVVRQRSPPPAAQHQPHSGLATRRGGACIGIAAGQLASQLRQGSAQSGGPPALSTRRGPRGSPARRRPCMFSPPAASSELRRRLRTEQVAHEVIPAPAHHVRRVHRRSHGARCGSSNRSKSLFALTSASTTSSVFDGGTLSSIRPWIRKQLALELGGVALVGLVVVVGLPSLPVPQQALPLLRPVVLVVAVVVVAALG